MIAIKKKMISINKNEVDQRLVFIFLPILASYLLIFTGCTNNQKSQQQNQIVLTVNSHDISAEEFALVLAQKLKHYDTLYVKDPANLKYIKNETIKAMILDEITKDYAKSQGLVVTDEELQSKITEIRNQYPDELAFRRSLADENLALDDWSAHLKFTILQRKVFEKISEVIKEPSQEDIKTYYQNNKARFHHPARVRLRQIVLEKEDDAKRIMDELQKGGSLEKLARQFSVAPESQNGGDTGWIEKGTLDVFDPAFKLPIKGRSGILESPYGFHIYEVIAKESEGYLSLDQANARIRAQLIEDHQAKAYSTWLDEQIRKASVKKNETLIEAIQVSTRGS